MTTECEAAVAELRESIERDLMEKMEEAVARGVKKGFRDVGLYADTLEQEAERRKDFDHLNKWRHAVEKAAVIIGTAVLTIVAGSALAAFWIGIRLGVMRQP